MIDSTRADLSAKKQQTLGDVVYNQVLAMIVEGEVPTNARLPSEALLAQRFGVSRPVVRQALAKLREERLIASRQGSGSFVQYARGSGKPPVSEAAPGPLAAPIRFEPLASLADLHRYFDFRIGIEGESAAGAALHRTPAQLEALLQSLPALEDLADTEDFGVEVDYAFHLKVAEASDNYFIVSVLQGLREQIMTGMTLARILSVKVRGQRLRLATASHRQIVAAIEARDPDGARRLMREHLEKAKLRLQHGIGATP